MPAAKVVRSLYEVVFVVCVVNRPTWTVYCVRVLFDALVLARSTARR